jgi:hypothetical protein
MQRIYRKIAFLTILSRKEEHKRRKLCVELRRDNGTPLTEVDELEVYKHNVETGHTQKSQRTAHKAFSELHRKATWNNAPFKIKYFSNNALTHLHTYKNVFENNHRGQKYL